MELSRVVVRFKDGTLMKGKTSDFSPNRDRFHLEMLNAEVVDLDIEHLKAIFFVRDLEGNKDRKDVYGDVIAGGGRKIQVTFSDGELLTGYSLSYAPDRHGFFVTPADMQSNNERIFLINSAVEKIEFL